MCGIAGFYSTEQRFSRGDLERMTTRIAHRGPDAAGYFQEGAVGLGHRRLSIIDLSESANQPMYSHDDQYVIVFNGEIYNFQEIRKELPGPWKTQGDTEVILESFRKWGPDCVQRFNGMFALAIYNRADQSLTLLRDRFGVKPLYYYWNGKDLAFASELKALLELPIEKELDLPAIKDYFFLEYIPAQSTPFKFIRRLGNGHRLVLKQGEIRVEQYYNLLDKIGKPLGLRSENEYIDALHEQLASSIRYRQISDVPIGAFLSGGTDSSLICSVFQEQNERPINTFTIGFDVAQYDETGYAGRVADILKTNHRVHHATEAYAKTRVEHLADHYDEPFAVPSMIPSLQVCQEARKDVTVALSGDGGDELFMGYNSYNWYPRIRRVNRIAGAAGRKLLSKALSYMGSTKERGGRMFDYPSEEGMWLHAWSQEQYCFNEKEIGTLFNTSYQHETLLPAWKEIDSLPIHPFEKISLFDINHYLANNLLYKMDIASMASSLEVRLPFLDYHLVEFALNVPVDYKIHGKTMKYLPKKLLERYLPHDIVYHPKWGFPAPVGHWLKGELGFLIDHYLDPALLSRQGILNVKQVQRLVLRFRGGTEFLFKQVWALIYFQMWYCKYFDPALCV